MCPLGFQARLGSLICTGGGGGVCATCSLRFTSVVTPADLLAAGMATEPFSTTYLRAGIGGALL